MRVCFQITSFFLAVNFCCQPLRAQGESVCPSIIPAGELGGVCVSVSLSCAGKLGWKMTEKVCNCGFLCAPQVGTNLLIRWQLAPCWPGTFRSNVVRTHHARLHSQISQCDVPLLISEPGRLAEFSSRCILNQRSPPADPGGDMSGSTQLFQHNLYVLASWRR